MCMIHHLLWMPHARPSRQALTDLFLIDTMISSIRPILVYSGSLLVLIAGYMFAGCDLREVVEVERPFFKPPPSEAAGFLGYDDIDDKLTVCGNCHSGQQAEWKGTAHAAAWAGLQESGHAQAFCENCHSVNALGNITEEPGGWSATGDERYHDVQCESCHGPGEVHVSNPDLDASHPIASLDVGDLNNLDNAMSCAQCHQGAHHPFAEEWASSGHANIIGFAADRESCQSCHTGQGALAAWGITDSYAEKDSDVHMAITCGVCHDPHSNENEGQLRFSVATASIEENLCARCHNRRTVPDPGSSHGLEPHAPQAALLLGEAGWFPPNVELEQGEILGTHGSEANERLCASCHVNSYEITDEATGEFVFNSTGHLFAAIPCVDANGIPNNAGDCGIAVTERSFNGCATGGCHASEDNAAQALASTTNRIQELADTLLAALALIDPNLDEAGGEIDASDPTFTVAEGAFFNYHLATFGDDVYSASVHNPYLTESLLVASMAALEDTYSSALPATLRGNWENRLNHLKTAVQQKTAGLIPLTR